MGLAICLWLPSRAIRGSCRDWSSINSAALLLLVFFPLPFPLCEEQVSILSKPRVMSSPIIGCLPVGLLSGDLKDDRFCETEAETS